MRRALRTRLAGDDPGKKKPAAIGVDSSNRLWDDSKADGREPTLALRPTDNLDPIKPDQIELWGHQTNDGATEQPTIHVGQGTYKAGRQIPPALERNCLWTLAFGRLEASRPNLLTTFETIIHDGDLDDAQNAGERLALAVIKKKNEMLDKQWTLRFMNHKVKVRESVQRIVKVVQTLQSFGNIATQIDPIHAGLPVAAVNTLLTLVLNDSQQNEVALNGIEEVNLLVARYASIEEIYLDSEDATLMPEFREGLITLYMKILEFQATAACHFGRNTFLRSMRSTLHLEDWAKLLNEVKKKDVVCSGITKLLDSKYQQAGQGEVMEALRQQETTLRNLQDKLRLAQQENLQALRWFSDVQ